MRSSVSRRANVDMSTRNSLAVRTAFIRVQFVPRQQARKADAGSSTARANRSMRASCWPAEASATLQSVEYSSAKT